MLLARPYPARDNIRLVRISPSVVPVSKQAENRSIERHSEGAARDIARAAGK